MKIALVHDSFTQMGGAERVLDALHELYPDAPVFTLVFDPKFKDKYKGWDIRTSQLQTLYLALGKLQYLFPLIPWGVDNLNFSGYDLVISSSSGFVKNIRVPKGCVHINYCHTPARFLWSDPDYIKQEVPLWLRPVAGIIIRRMKDWDFRGAQRVTEFIANSKEVQNRIKRYYNRDSTVIYPFVDNDFWHPMQFSPPAKEEYPTPAGGGGDIKNYFLIVARLQAHKQTELIIKIFNNLNLPLHIIGTGRQEEYLKSISKPNIKFLGHISDEQLRQEYSGAKALIFPQTEDFGLVPLEAAACDTPALAYGKAGALETISPGVTGELFKSHDELKRLIQSWNFRQYKADSLRSQAEKFSKDKFKNNILDFINK